METALSTSALVTAALLRPFAGEDGEFKAPGIDEFVGLPALFFEGTPFEINRIIMVRLIALTIMVVLMYLALRKTRLVPGRGQGVAEMALDFVRVQIAEQILGERLGRKFLPLLASLFFAILAMNITGIVPFANIAGTSLVGMPLTMALVSYVAFIYAGIREVGGWAFIKNALFPPGVPWPLYILLAPVELINIFIMRPVSLALRLLLNMMVGHLLLVLAFSSTNFFFVSVSGPAAAFGALTLTGGIVITLFELLIAVLQAYVFTLLTAVYIQQAASEHH
ncbi:ATP synthase F0 subcomplex A subunit [Microcella putealis]|uniref:ATP synthase subunit a n=1 Tax=Microcella putealis TaxID=337005 RepID=A0A4Q7LWV2_9MICO|nr:F0F1 ATP synthase subunit A [Microcella putealis]RZS59171.1 ATP synthase F0 subcomplex A subunit [Microcella putealis]TQM24197.1 ATP synthase F0 subcomplex A subunit [Microcella putealis]